MLTSNVVILSPLLNFLVPFRPPPNWSRLQLIKAPTSRSRLILPTFSRLCFLLFRKLFFVAVLKIHEINTKVRIFMKV